MAEATEMISDIKTQAKTFFASLPTAQKWLLLGVLSVVMLGLVIFIYFAKQPTYTNLVSGITPKEASQVAAKLESSQIPYQVAPGGGGILVQSEMADRAKLEIANSDLLNGGLVGLEIFDKTNYTSTEFEQNVQLRRALEGELARLIGKINLIENAKVILALPSKSVFIDKEERPSAAVHLQLKDSSPLDPSRVKTILNLVASGVPGLKIGDVKISDQYGNLYTSEMSGMKNGGEGQGLVFKNNIEKYLESKVLDQLQKLAPAGGVKVKVAAEINNESSVIEEKLMDPELQVVVSEQTNQEKTTDTKTIPLGIPGVSSNSPEIKAGTGEAANVAGNSKTTRMVNYENSVRNVKRETSPGEIKRLTLSILIDDKEVVTKNADESLSVSRAKWTQEELGEIGSIAQNAIGFNAERGDKMEIRNLSFSVKESKIEETVKKNEILSQDFKETWSAVVKYLLAGLVTILMIFFVIRPLMNKISGRSDDPNVISGLPSSVKDIENRESVDLELKDSDNYQNIPSIPQRGQIIEMAKKDTVQTASLIRNWLKEN